MDAFQEHFTLIAIITFKIINLSSKVIVSELHVRGLTYFIVIILHERIAPFMLMKAIANTRGRL